VWGFVFLIFFFCLCGVLFEWRLASWIN
jgi:hypothetical protein